MAKKSFIALTGLVILAVAGWLRPPIAAPVPMPNPNGYDDFQKAGQLYVERSLADHNYWDLDHERLRSFVRTNAEALKLARLGLSKECRVPVEYSESFWNNIPRDSVAILNLARALSAERLLAEMEHHTNAAIIACLDSIRLGRAASCGGLVIHGMNGEALERNGVSGLQRLTPGLDPSTYRDIIKTLESLEARRESPEEFLRREKECWRASNGMMTRIRTTIANKSFDPTVGYRAAFVTRFKDIQRQTDFLMLDLAARAFELEKGRRPQSAKELVPDYLKAVPKDPTTGADLALPP